jgi:hypothetical protein
MSDKLIDRLKQALEKKIYGLPPEQRDAELAAGDVFVKRHFAQMAFNDIFNLLKQNAAGIAFTIESKLIGRSKSFEQKSDEHFIITLGTVQASVELDDESIAATITKGDPPAETRTLVFNASLQDGSIFLTRADSPMSIYPDDALGDILETVIELVD